VTYPVTAAAYTWFMAHEPAPIVLQTVDEEWVTFPGGELEGKRPKALCPACRASLTRIAASGGGAVSGGSRPLCFQCYRADLERERALQAAGALNTASEARFQSQLPFEPVNHGRLEMLKAARTTARAASVQGIGQYVDKRRHAQMAARRALQAIAAGLKAREMTPMLKAETLAAAAHAAELQLPEAWVPFVVSR
jgi:hypothetical protein